MIGKLASEFLQLVDKRRIRITIIPKDITN